MYKDIMISKCKNIIKDVEKFDEMWTPLSYVDDDENQSLIDLIESVKEQMETLERGIRKMEGMVNMPKEEKND